ncbi:uncharacterized protein [Palaemon carinicauda]|uniref:uncharacterized protein isoform X2 n=1 Tax=Palaemon carinicauda TaxID=392227 RepID=UPI0035B627BA
MESTTTNARFAEKNPDVSGGTKFREASRAILQEVINFEAATTLAGMATLHDPFMRHQLLIAYQNQDLLLATMEKQESSGADNPENTQGQAEDEEICQERKDEDSVECSSKNGLRNSEVNVSLGGTTVNDVSSAGFELQVNSGSEQQENKEINNLDILPENCQVEASLSQETMNAAYDDALEKELLPDVDLTEMSPCQEEVGKTVTALEMIAGYAEIFTSPN